VPQQPESAVTTDLRTGVSDRIAEFDWEALTEAFDQQGFAQTTALYDRQQCERLAARFEDGNFRSTIDMRRYRFGEGEYKYFDSPLPNLIDDARRALYSLDHEVDELLKRSLLTHSLTHSLDRSVAQNALNWGCSGCDCLG
jgi:hypothetical protein